MIGPLPIILRPTVLRMMAELALLIMQAAVIDREMDVFSDDPSIALDFGIDGGPADDLEMGSFPDRGFFVDSAIKVACDSQVVSDHSQQIWTFLGSYFPLIQNSTASNAGPLRHVRQFGRFVFRLCSLRFPDERLRRRPFVRLRLPKAIPTSGSPATSFSVLTTDV
jgi:hypothetical protein